jgi:hypothetical protein
MQTSSGASRLGLLQEGGDVRFLARIERAADRLAAGFLDVGDERRELVAVAPPTTVVKPSAANLRAIAAPMKSPAPTDRCGCSFVRTSRLGTSEGQDAVAVEKLALPS